MVKPILPLILGYLLFTITGNVRMFVLKIYENVNEDYVFCTVAK
jgi:hypothetical protein